MTTPRALPADTLVPENTMFFLSWGGSKHENTIVSEGIKGGHPQFLHYAETSVSRTANVGTVGKNGLKHSDVSRKSKLVSFVLAVMFFVCGTFFLVSSSNIFMILFPQGFTCQLGRIEAT